MKGQRFHLQHSRETVFISVTNGIYLERWDRIDYKRVKFLLMDSRYPRLPSKTICLPDFQQPQSWADYFGARARTYFVPQQTGIYRFMLCEGIYFDSKNLYLSPYQACKKEEVSFRKKEIRRTKVNGVTVDQSLWRQARRQIGEYSTVQLNIPN